MIEWVDSVLLILRGKDLIPPSNIQFGLHVFHHTVTTSIVWTSWKYPISTSWLGPITNSFVHVVMYGYYAATDLGLSRRWGTMVITPLQLTQFVVCLLWVSFEWVAMAMWGSHACGSDVRTLTWVYLCYVVFLILFYIMYSGKKTTLLKEKPKSQ